MIVQTRKVPALIQVPIRPAPLPAIRVDNTVIWPGGYARELTRWERLRLWARWPPLRLPLPPLEQRLLQARFSRELEMRMLFGDGHRPLSKHDHTEGR